MISPPAGRSGQVPLGIQAALRTRSGPALAAAIQTIRSAGLSYTREDFTWATIEPIPGLFCWDATDQWMTALANNGLRVIAVPDATPSWVAPSPDDAPTGAATALYAAFVKELLGRYGLYGSFWAEHPDVPPAPIQLVDLWNEPYSVQFWDRGFPDPAGYARMFEQTVVTARQVDPEAQFLLEADTTALNSGSQVPFLSAVLAAEPSIAQDAYAVSVHPYASGGVGPDVCTRSAPLEARRFEVCRIEDIRNILDQAGANRVGIWITELGWSTAPKAPGAVSPILAAIYLERTFDLLRTTWRGLVQGLIWYAYQTPQSKPTLAGDYFGLIGANGTRTPAWLALTSESNLGLPAG